VDLTMHVPAKGVVGPACAGGQKK